MSTLPASSPPAAAAPQARGSLGLFYLIYLAVLTGPAAALAWLLLFEAPRFEAIFRDFRTQLPTLTLWLLQFSHFCRSFWALLAGVLLFFLIPLVLAWISMRPRTTTGRAFTMLLLIALLVAAVLTALFISQMALFQPLSDVVHSVSGGTRP